jgi:hypothetical protein
MAKWILIFLVTFFSYKHFFKSPKLKEAGPFLNPVQTKLEKIVLLNGPIGFAITSSNKYELTAMILGRDRYYFDPLSKISPIDLILGWGPSTTKLYLSKVKYSQYGRWYHFHYDDERGMNQRDIELNTANTHIIPEFKNASLKKKILNLKVGDVVKLSGYLVDVDGPDGFNWHSSLSREDTGDGACEVFYVN